MAINDDGAVPGSPSGVSGSAPSGSTVAGGSGSAPSAPSGGPGSASGGGSGSAPSGSPGPRRVDPGPVYHPSLSGHGSEIFNHPSTNRPTASLLSEGVGSLGAPKNKTAPGSAPTPSVSGNTERAPKLSAPKREQTNRGSLASSRQKASRRKSPFKAA